MTLPHRQPRNTRLRLPTATLSTAILLLLFTAFSSVVVVVGTMTLTSAAFSSNADIPQRYTCQGNDKSPPLSWSDVPGGTSSLVLIVDDPDAPDPAHPNPDPFVHWVVYDINPQTTTGFGEGDIIGGGAKQATNGFRRNGYGGPCPPIGEHRYFFTLFALDVGELDGLTSSSTKDDIVNAMVGHVLEKTELVGKYEKLCEGSG